MGGGKTWMSYRGSLVSPPALCISLVCLCSIIIIITISLSSMLSLRWSCVLVDKHFAAIVEVGSVIASVLALQLCCHSQALCSLGSDTVICNIHAVFCSKVEVQAWSEPAATAAAFGAHLRPPLELLGLHSPPPFMSDDCLVLVLFTHDLFRLMCLHCLLRLCMVFVWCWLVFVLLCLVVQWLCMRLYGFACDVVWL